MADPGGTLTPQRLACRRRRKTHRKAESHISSRSSFNNRRCFLTLKQTMIDFYQERSGRSKLKIDRTPNGPYDGRECLAPLRSMYSAIGPLWRSLPDFTCRRTFAFHEWSEALLKPSSTVKRFSRRLRRSPAVRDSRKAVADSEAATRAANCDFKGRHNQRRSCLAPSRDTRMQRYFLLFSN
jgi:hypothetical protein